MGKKCMKTILEKEFEDYQKAETIKAVAKFILWMLVVAALIKYLI